MVVKASICQGPNLRFVVTSLPASAIDARILYEDLYCGRGATVQAGLPTLPGYRVGGS